MTRRDMKAIASLGGQSLKTKVAPESCERCGKSFSGKMWLSFLGHLGLHGLADRHFRGDIKAAQKQLQRNSLAKQEAGSTWSNGAWMRHYRPISQATRIIQLEEDLQHARHNLQHGVTEGWRAAAKTTIELIEIELKELRNGHL